MAGSKTISRYQISLEANIERSDESRKALFDIQSALTDLQKQADSLDFDKASDGLKNLQKDFKENADNAGKYRSELQKYYDAVQRQADQLNYSLSEAGKRDRERRKQLEAQTNLTKQERKELEQLQKRTIAGSDQELKKYQLQNRALRAQIKAQQTALKGQKTANDLIKQDLKGLTDRIKKQKEYIKSLSATGKAYVALKKAGKLAFGAGKIAAAGVGIIGGITAAGMAGAQAEADKEKEAARIRASLSPDDKRGLISALYMRTGASASEIVDAINRVVIVLGRNASRGELEAATAAEIRLPGASELFRSQTGGRVDYRALEARMERIQGLTGLTGGALSDVAKAVTQMRDRSFRSGASQIDLVALTAALQGAGVFDSTERQERALRVFLSQLKPGQDFFAAAQAFSWERYAGRSSQARARARAGIASLDFAGLGRAVTAEGQHEESTAEKAAMRMRQIEEYKNKLIMRVLEHTFPYIDSVFSWLEKNGLKYFDRVIESILGLMPGGESRVLTYKMERQREREALRLEKSREKLLEDLVNIQDEQEKKQLVDMTNSSKSLEELQLIADYLTRNNRLEGVDLATANGVPQRSNGGLLVGPGIVGERGQELVVPLDYSRQGRANNIVQNITQSFNMHGNETTALSLSQAVKSRGFNRDLFLQRRHGGI
jgi:hypothetical protein